MSCIGIDLEGEFGCLKNEATVRVSDVELKICKYVIQIEGGTALGGKFPNPWQVQVHSGVELTMHEDLEMALLHEHFPSPGGKDQLLVRCLNAPRAVETSLRDLYFEPCNNEAVEDSASAFIVMRVVWAEFDVISRES